MARKAEVGSKASICQTCGSENNQVLLHRCIKCHISAIHRYCFSENPDKIDENYPYICQQCLVVPVSGTSPKRTYEFCPCPSRLRKHQRVEQPDDELIDEELDIPTSVLLPSLERHVSNLPEADLNIEEAVDVQTSVCNPQLEDVLSDNVRSLIEEDCEKPKDHLPFTLAVKSYAQPIFEPCWRGTFEMCEAKFDHLQAHLSSIACLKVVETAKLMPAIVSTKIVPRLEIWPKSFRESKPTVENIGLYIFPTSESGGVKAFDQMMSRIMEMDCALKVLLDNAELLLFSSTELPVGYWRFSGKVYLWGVFTARKDTLSPSSCVTKSVRSSPVSSLSNPCSYSPDMPNEKENIEKLKTNSTLPTESDAHSLDMSISASEKTNDIPSDDIESQLEVKEIVSEVVYNKGVCYKCWKKRKIENTIAEIIEKANAKGLCLKCCGPGHEASGCTSTTISGIECFNCGELTTSNEIKLDFFKPQQDVIEIVSMVVNNQSLMKTVVDGRSTVSIRKDCSKLQEQGSKNLGEKSNIAVKGSGNRPNENEVEEKCCDFCGAPDHLQPQCEWYIFAARDMDNCRLEDTRLFSRDFEAMGNVCNTTAGVGGVLPVYHNFTREEPYHPENNVCSNAGRVQEPYFPSNSFGCSIGGIGRGQYCREEPYNPTDNVCNNFRGVGPGPYDPAPNVWNNSQGVGGGSYLPANNVEHMVGWRGGGSNFLGNNVCNNFGGVGGITYHPASYGEMGGPYLDARWVGGRPLLPVSYAPFPVGSSNNAWW